MVSATLSDMKQILLMIAVVALVGCGGKKEDGNTGVVNPNKSSPKAVPVNIADPIVEKAIREELKKPTGEFTKADLEKVTRLNLTRNQLTSVKGLEDLTQLIENLTQLKEPSLTRNQLTEVPKGLEKLPKLKALWLFDNQLTSVKGLEKLTQLTFLNLSFNQLTDVKGLEKLTQLMELWLDNNHLTELPKGLEKLTQLEELTLTGNQLTDVTGLEKLTQLTQLNLRNNQLTSVKGLEKLTQLEYLNLEINQLTDVKGLEKLTKLTHLYLENNPDLTKTQIDELKKALPKCKISCNPTK